MKRIRSLLPLGLIGFLIVLSLLAGCYRPASPDVTATPAAGAEDAPSEQEQMATAAAESTRTAEMAAATATPTEVPPTSTPTPTATAVPPAPATSTPTPTFTPLPPGQVTHIVQRGENLFRIALRYGTTVQAIATANGIANPARIYVGQKLTISTPGGQPPPPPAGATYVVQPGDNLFRIALRYNLSYLYLAQYNGIGNPSYIYAGQVLRIPPR